MSSIVVQPEDSNQEAYNKIKVFNQQTQQIFMCWVREHPKDKIADAAQRVRQHAAQLDPAPDHYLTAIQCKQAVGQHRLVAKSASFPRNINAVETEELPAEIWTATIGCLRIVNTSIMINWSPQGWLWKILGSWIGTLCE